MKNDNIYTPSYPTGWVCPKCGAVMSPTQNTCIYCLPTLTPTVNYGSRESITVATDEIIVGKDCLKNSK